MEKQKNRYATRTFSKQISKVIGVFLALLVLLPAAAWSETSYETIWLRQEGTASGDIANDVAVDGSGNVYVAGYTVEGSYTHKAFIAKYTSAGEKLWGRQMGTLESAIASSVAVDANGNVYITGGTEFMTFMPSPSDIFIAKFSTTGEALWFTQLEGLGKNAYTDVAVDGSGNVYITGDFAGLVEISFPLPLFLAKFNADSGEKLWLRKIGGDAAYDIAADATGNVYVTGRTYGALEEGKPNAGYGDMFLAKFSPALGDKVWVRQIGSISNDSGQGVAVDGSGNVYVTGATNGALEEGKPKAGDYDIFLAKFSADTGDKHWLRQLGSTDSDDASGVAVDGSGNVYVTGRTYGALEEGKSNVGEWDTFLAKFSAASGDKLWLRQVGSASSDYGNGVAADGTGNVYVTGYTYGALEEGKPNAGGEDLFLAKFGSALVISPLQLSFGEIGIGEHGTAIVTATNVCKADRQITSLEFLTGSNADYSFSAPPLPATISPNGTLDIPLTYSPTAPGEDAATLRVVTNDPNRPSVDILLSGTGVVTTFPPSEQITKIIGGFDTGISTGTITGSGSGNSVDGRMNALRNMLKAVDDLIAAGKIPEACQQLSDTYLRVDGLTPPPDFVQGSEVATIAAEIMKLKQTLGCP